jgi:hypothetical protein
MDSYNPACVFLTGMTAFHLPSQAGPNILWQAKFCLEHRTISTNPFRIPAGFDL